MVLAGLLSLSRSTPYLFKYNSTFKLSNHDRDTLQTLVSETDRQRILASRFLAGLLVEKMGIKSLAVDQMTYSKFGKPILLDCHISISHSGDFVAVAISDSEDIGIDIQEQKPIDLKDFESFFSEDELHRLNSMTGDRQLKSFFDLWTKKEAVMKADGRGMSLKIRDIILYEDKAAVVDKGSIWFQCPCPLIDGYSLSLYSEKADNGIMWVAFQDGNLVTIP